MEKLSKEQIEALKNHYKTFHMDMKQRIEFGLIGVSNSKYQGIKEDKPRQYRESNEQGTLAGYIKLHHPTLRFKTNKPEGRKSYRAQNEIKKKSSNAGFPDMDIEKPVAPYSGLKIENKRSGTALTSKGKLKDQFAHQYVCHRQLIKDGYAVYFACSVSEAIEILERYLIGNAMPFTEYVLSDKMQYEYNGEY